MNSQETKQKLFLLFLFCISTVVFAQEEKKYYFYNHVPYGSEALYNPLSMVLNGGYDPFQMLDREPTWNNMYWRTASTNVWRCITAPAPIINKFGWKRFISTELFPTNLKIEEGQYAPNYALHLIGGGMEYRKISEWYDYHNVPLPFVCGALTSMAFEYLNEIVENGMNYYPNIDCIPDILVFQPLGILLFSFDDVAEFFSSSLQLNDWSHQVGITFAPFAVRNAAQIFVAKVPLNSMRTKSLFINFGTFALVGYSTKLDAEHSLSFGAGLTSKGRKALPLQNGVPSNTIVVGPMAGIYYDRNNSLLASFVVADTYYMRYRLNVYPGVLALGSWSPGIFCSLDANGHPTLGVTLTSLPVGVGHKF